MMRRSCSLRGRSRPPSAQTADTARLSMSAACFMDSSTLPLTGPFAVPPMNDNILYHALATRLVQVVARLPSLFNRSPVSCCHALVGLPLLLQALRPIFPKRVVHHPVTCRV